MRTMGIRELKAGLSRALRDVAAGEVVLVTDRGRVVAELRAPDASISAGSAEDRALARLATSGRLRLAERPPSPYRKSPLRSPKGLGRKLIDAERGD